MASRRTGLLTRGMTATEEMIQVAEKAVESKFKEMLAEIVEQQ
jgi:hypothetical protein